MSSIRISRQSSLNDSAWSELRWLSSAALRHAEDIGDTDGFDPRHVLIVCDEIAELARAFDAALRDRFAQINCGAEYDKSVESVALGIADVLTDIRGQADAEIAENEAAESASDNRAMARQQRSTIHPGA
jgi:hypothetical protein